MSPTAPILEQEVVDLLKKRKAVLCSIESCTGGLIASRITGIAGASAVFWGALITYDNSAKMALAGVAAETLEDHGAVSGPVAAELASGGLKIMRESLRLPQAGISEATSFLSVSVTGIAGPSGGTPEKPVGLCYLGLAWNQNPIAVLEIRADSNRPRTEQQRFFSEKALELLRSVLVSG